MTERTIKLLSGLLEEKLVSKVEGRRNYCIIIRNYNDNKLISFKGGFGQANRRGLLCNSIASIVKYNIRIYEFTYKKDYEETLRTLENLGYKY